MPLTLWIRIFHSFFIGVLFGLFATSAQCAESTKSPVQPLGEFAKVRATEDHTYGHRLRLWHSGGQLLGEILYWDGDIEGERGRFVDGAYNRSTGAVKFSLVIARSNVQPNTRSEASFEGVLGKGVLSGKLKWVGEAAKFRGKNGVEDLVLPLQKEERLAPFASLEAWRRAMGE
jgi:hypothetical protein